MLGAASDTLVASDTPTAGVFRNNPASEVLRSDHPGSMRGMLEHLGYESYRAHANVSAPCPQKMCFLLPRVVNGGAVDPSKRAAGAMPA